MAADVARAKAELWKRLFGADLSPELVAALCYVDVRERVLKLTNGGWVRDEGTKMLASGGDPQVVALLVAAAQAKGWKAVRIWGDAEFLREARRQFEAAGIPVTEIAPPPDSIIEPVEAPPAAPGHDPADVLAEFGRRRAEAEALLAEFRRPSDEPTWLQRARNKEHAADAAWRKATGAYDAAKRAKDEAEKNLAAVSLFGRGDARRRLAAAKAEFEALREAFDETRGRLKDARETAAEGQREFERSERQRRAKQAGEERRAQAEAIFAVECERVATELPEIADQGVEAVADEARARLAARAAQRDRFDAADVIGESPSPSGVRP